MGMNEGLNQIWVLQIPADLAAVQLAGLLPFMGFVNAVINQEETLSLVC